MSKGAVLAVIMVFLYSSGAFASSSADYVISVEAFGGGGSFESSSSHYKVNGIINGIANGIRTSTSYRLGEGFMNASFNALALTPVITSISPASGNNNGPVSVTINGVNFQTEAVASLERTGQPDISGEGLIVVDTTKITCSFNLTGALTGAWSVVVRNPDGRVGVLTGGFTITKPSGRIKVIGRPINYPNPFDPDKGSTTIKFTLSKDGAIELNIFNINGERIWQRKYPPGVNGGKAGDNLILWDGFTAFNQEIPNGIYVFQIASGGETLATGKIAVFR